MKKKKADRQVTITGIVTASDWDEDHNIIAVTISTPDEDEYRINDKGKGKDLLDFVQEEVKATGSLSEDEDGDKILTVKKYEVLEKEEDWEEEEQGERDEEE